MKRLRSAPLGTRPTPSVSDRSPSTSTGFGERLGIGARAHDDGLEVIRVEPGSLAEDLELQAGDIVLELNGVSILDPADVRDALSRSRGKVEIQLLRDGVKHNVSLERS